MNNEIRFFLVTLLLFMGITYSEQEATSTLSEILSGKNIEKGDIDQKARHEITKRRAEKKDASVEAQFNSVELLQMKIFYNEWWQNQDESAFSDLNDDKKRIVYQTANVLEKGALVKRFHALDPLLYPKIEKTDLVQPNPLSVFMDIATLKEQLRNILGMLEKDKKLVTIHSGKFDKNEYAIEELLMHRYLQRITKKQHLDRIALRDIENITFIPMKHPKKIAITVAPPDTNDIQNIPRISSENLFMQKKSLPLEEPTVAERKLIIEDVQQLFSLYEHSTVSKWMDFITTPQGLFFNKSITFSYLILDVQSFKTVLKKVTGGSEKYLFDSEETKGVFIEKLQSLIKRKNQEKREKMSYSQAIKLLESKHKLAEKQREQAKTLKERIELVGGNHKRYFEFSSNEIFTMTTIKKEKTPEQKIVSPKDGTTSWWKTTPAILGISGAIIGGVGLLYWLKTRKR